MAPNRSTTPAAPGAAPVHRLFEARVELAPDAEALSAGGERITYRELDRRANGLAHRLRGLGVGPEERVGLCCGRGPELVVGLLGILKAGGAYVPFDPAYPAERLRLLLEDTAPRVVVADREAAGFLPARAGAVVHPDPALRADAPPAAAARPEHLAYVIHTSGSTGRPKGVMAEHRNLAASLLALRDALALGPGDRVAALASFAFDISLFELLAPLVSGAAVVLVPHERVLDPEALAGEVAGATVVHAVPGLMRRIVEPARGGRFRRARAVLVGGEAVPPPLLREMRDAFPAARLHVLYGPTEATIVCAAHRVPENGRVPGRMIGRALGGARLRLAGADGREVPGEGEGELWVGGPGVTRGYLGLAALTAERYPAADGERWYRTGDLARRLPDGSLEFLGRADDQVKVRGFRIEPAEVEAALAEHPGVREAAVAVRADGAGEGRLAAYVVARDGDAPDAAALREHLAARLPGHLVPETFTRLGALPRSPSGKTDRAALPDPSPASPGEGGEAPLTPLERRLAWMWAETLGGARVRRGDSFFALGGSSLDAMRLLARIRGELHVELPASALFAADSLAALAGRVEAAPPARGEDPYAAPVPRPDPAPLSHAQESVRFLEELYSGMRSFSFHATLRFRGTLRVAVLEAALGEVVRRHEVLRTTFPVVDGRAVQRVHPARPVRLPVADLRALPERRREAEVRERLAAEFSRGHDLARLPLVRWTLLRVGDGEWVLTHAEHHFLHDGRSFALLLGELDALYAAFARGEPSPLPEPALQYADYAARQRAWVRGPAAAAQAAFWRERLEGVPVLELPADRPRPAVMSFRGGSRRGRLPAAAVAAARALAARRGTTLYAVLQSAFQALLGRYAGQEDFAVGCAVAARRWPSLEGVMGFVVNTVALRAHLGGEPAFAELLGRVRRTVAEAVAHQELPFELVVEALRPERTLSRLPVYQAAFSFHDSPYPRLRLSGVAAEVADGLGNGYSKAELNVIGIPHAEQSGAGADDVTLLWEYAADRFDPATVERMAGHFETLLAGAAADPDRRVSELPLLAPGERETLLRAWGGSGSEGAAPDTLDRPFREQARRTPDAPAVECGEAVLSYGELDDRAGRLAARLATLGVRPGVRVALCVERSPEVAVGILGILRAGGAYVPLDPEYPAGRLAYMLEDSGAAVLVARGRLRGRFAGFRGEVVDVDAPAPGGAAPPHAASPGSLAYVIYTSGSTGRPKGVGVHHAGPANVVAQLLRLHPLGPGDRGSLYASPSFDASVFELFTALGAGATAVLVPEEVRTSAAELVAWLAGARIDTAYVPVFALGELADRLERDPGGWRLRRLFVGVEPIPEPLLVRIVRAVPGMRVLNGYGPTEASIAAAAHPVRAASRREGRTPIGRPLPGTSAYVLDGALRLLPAGVPGELYLGGAGVTPGYLGRPDATAERFLPDPFAEGAPGGARMYRTGDRARWLPEGELEFLGRTDDQVKVRGIRVEPGEAAAALADHPGVGEAVVVAREDARGALRLLAYAVPAPDAAPSPAALRAHLEARLPAHLVPAWITVLPALPRTPGGKVDRGALSAPEETGRTDGYVAPRTDAERAVAAVFAEVLGVPRVGAEDDFFALGGHSLAATQAVSRLREPLGPAVTLRALFASRTVAALAALGAPAEPPPAAEPLAAPPPGREGTERLLESLDGLSDDEVSALLGELLAEEGGVP